MVKLGALGVKARNEEQQPGTLGTKMKNNRSRSARNNNEEHQEQEHLE
jgi:hypothetical protein